MSVFEAPTYVTTVPLPAALAAAAPFQSYTDPNGDVWVAQGNVSSGQWKRARDVMHSRVTRASAYNLTTSITHLGCDPGAATDPYGIYNSGWTLPIGGNWLLTGVLTFSMVANAWGRVRHYVNSAQVAILVTQNFPTAISCVMPVNGGVYKYNAGDVVQIFTDASATMAASTGAANLWFSMDYLGTG